VQLNIKMKIEIIVVYVMLFVLADCKNADNKKIDGNIPTALNEGYNLIYSDSFGLTWQKESLVLTILPHSVVGADGRKVEKALCRMNQDSNNFIVEFFDKSLQMLPKDINLIFVGENGPLNGSYTELLFDIPCEQLFKEIANETDIILEKRCNRNVGTVLNTFFFKNRYTILGSVEQDLGIDVFELYSQNVSKDYREVDQFIWLKMKDTLPKLHKQMLEFVPQRTWHFYDGYLSLIDSFSLIIRENRFPIKFSAGQLIMDNKSIRFEYKVVEFNLVIHEFYPKRRYFLFKEPDYSNGQVVFALHNAR